LNNFEFIYWAPVQYKTYAMNPKKQIEQFLCQILETIKSKWPGWSTLDSIWFISDIRYQL